MIIWDKWLKLDKFVIGYKRFFWGKTLEIRMKENFYFFSWPFASFMH
jgi:hypothetical protein